MKKRNNLLVGHLGEDSAAKFLNSCGYKIIERNFHKKYSEIDIVAIEAGTLVFVEVKTRQGRAYGDPIESITPWKVKHLIRSSHYYKLTHPDLPESMRIDVVSVNLSEDYRVEKIELFKNITI